MNNAINSTTLLSALVQSDRLAALAELIEDSDAALEVREASSTIAFLSGALQDRLKKSELAPTVLKFKMYSDPGHGWVGVKESFARELGFYDQISAYSYQKGKTIYLEEDADAGLLFAALEELGQEYEVVTTTFDKKAQIRNYPAFEPVDVAEPVEATEQEVVEPVAVEQEAAVEPEAVEPEVQVEETARERKNRKARELRVRRAAEKAAA